MPQYDVIIIGGGPAGLFAAMELAQAANLSVLLMEKGRDIDKRSCLIMEKGGVCPPCHPCHLVSGLGGAGAFSDGKLTLSPDVGGHLPEYLGWQRTQELIEYADNAYLRFGAKDHVFNGGTQVEDLQRRASLAELRLIPVDIRHMGTDRSRQVLCGMRDFLQGKVEIRANLPAARVVVEDGQLKGVETSKGECLECRYLIVAPGREGSDWLVKEARRLKLTLHNNPVDVGVRVEVPAAVMDSVTSILYEAKLEYFSRTFDDRIRTFCMCPAGEVIMDSTGGADPIATVNGHSYAERKTNNTNFALLVSTTFTEPFNDPIGYGKYIARLANILGGGGVLVQRLGDLQEGRRSTLARLERGIVQPTLKCAIPGDLSCVLPYRFLKGIVEMLEAMDKFLPGTASRHTLLYGVEVKFYSARLELSQNLESEIPNLFAAGDGAGVTRGLMQASVSGVVAAREILRRVGAKVSPAHPLAV
ncbi:MAG: NAD(P)/FAD-dependent oxidoreductase [Chloroflexi bacterium]|nr:NAD(P)/FAD-dependent oxidoreductase [Chloroflexota bacterium]